MEPTYPDVLLVVDQFLRSVDFLTSQPLETFSCLTPYTYSTLQYEKVHIFIPTLACAPPFYASMTRVLASEH